jgi:Lrp/AsnC family transcriptional regulator, leucine-responsive regulatory protein
MEKMDPDSPKLTENDKFVLKKILESRKMPDSDIAKSMNLSPQAIFKIRNKLEHIGIIKGYVPVIDFKKIGINIIVVLIIRLTPKVWTKLNDIQVSANIRNAPYVLDAYRVSDEYASHILVLAFRNTEQKEKYISDIQIKFAEEIDIRSIYTFSSDKIIMHSSLGILHEILNKKEFSPSDLFKK